MGMARAERPGAASDGGRQRWPNAKHRELGRRAQQ